MSRDDKFTIGVFVMGFVAIVVNTIFWGTVIYVAIHFVGKYW